MIQCYFHGKMRSLFSMLQSHIVRPVRPADGQKPETLLRYLKKHFRLATDMDKMR